MAWIEGANLHVPWLRGALNGGIAVIVRVQGWPLRIVEESPQKKWPSAVRIPIDPFEWPGIEMTSASRPYSDSEDPSSRRASGMNRSDLPKSSRLGMRALRRKLDFSLTRRRIPQLRYPTSGACEDAMSWAGHP